MLDKRAMLLNGRKESVARMLDVLHRSQSMIKELEIAERQHHKEVNAQLTEMVHPAEVLSPAGEPKEQLIRSELEAGNIVPLESFWSSFNYRGLQQRFFVCRLGSTGSAFLAKLIGAHPDVFCSHEGILWNRHDPTAGQSEREQQAFLAYVCSDSLHHAYKATGDVGSAWLSYLRLAPTHCSVRVPESDPPLRTGILLRHPLRVLKTQQFIAASDCVSLPANAVKEMVKYFAANGISCDIENETDSVIRNFIWTCYVWRETAIHGNCLGVQIHIENMNDLEYAQEKLLSLTGVEYSVELISPLLGKVVNTRTGDVESTSAIYENLPPLHQHWYKSIVEDAAESIGYSK